jgi:two-component system OmpR family sensor kinase
MAGLLGRLRSLGLRWRLAACVAAVMMVSTAITFVVVYRGSGTQLRAQIDREMEDAANDLARAITVSGKRTADDVVQAANGYLAQQPFRSTSTLLLAVVPSGRAGAGEPQLFADGRREAIESPAEEARARGVASRLTRAPIGYSTFARKDLGRLRLLKRVMRVAGGLSVTIGVAEPLRTVAHAQAGVARAFVLAGLIALAGALLAAYLIGTRMSRPLRRMAAVATQVDAGDLQPRIGEVGSRADEVGVLAEAFDHMLDRLTAAFAGQRAFVADASHELRTPLTVIRGQLELLAGLREPSGEEVRRVERVVQTEIARVTRLVDDLLLLARSEHEEFLRMQPIELVPFVRALWRDLPLLGARRYELAPVPAGTLTADPDRLAQALRNLLLNAVEHTAEREGVVRMRARAPGESRIVFCVEDDGPGIPPAERERVFDRFKRLDTARDRASGGAGLGLAIVRAIAAAHGGRVVAGGRRAPGAGAARLRAGHRREAGWRSCGRGHAPPRIARAAAPLHRRGRARAQIGAITAAPAKRPARRSSSAAPASCSG